MKLLLDTNSLSFLLRNDSAVRAHFESASASPETLFVLSPMVDFASPLSDPERCQPQSAQYEALTAHWTRAELAEADWDLAAELWAERHRAGAPIEDADLLIAVSALRQNAILVTSNQRHFSNLGLEMVDWRKSIRA